MLKNISYIALFLSITLLAAIFIGDFAFVTTNDIAACNMMDPPLFCEETSRKEPSIWLILTGIVSLIGFVALIAGGRKKDAAKL